ncbi:helix-hairpin-helix domain-containing protein [Nonomuraea sp. NPDC050556]|uniref:helix-hairpin-helix domain-containing protein n=1 Tax=Nonomuraea sp. NPDC050556 TaxID=3364369 RepID=UPI00379EBBD1
MRTPDPTSEQTIAESRLRSITTPATGVRPPNIPQSFQAFRTAISTQAPTLDPGRPAVRILLILAVIAALAGAIYAWQSQPTPAPLPPPPSPTAPPTPAQAPTPTTGVTIHVTGKVRHPAVYTLPTGARVADAVEAAGGVRPGASTGTINLARRLMDGEQIIVGAPAQPGTQPAPAQDPASTILDLNTATPDQLEQLPGVGEVLAQRITDYRTAHGGFRSVDQLREVTGIGPRKYEEIKPKVHT